MNKPDEPPRADVSTKNAETEEIRIRKNDLQDEVTDMIAYALWLHWKQRPPKRDLSATRHWARYATAHLELCGIEWTQKPPAKCHSDENF